MSYRLWERKEDSFGGLPVERPHGEVVILPLSDSQLFLKILKGIEGVAGIEFFIVLSMTALHFPVVSGSVGLNELMPDAELLQGGLKERFLFGSLRVQPVREFRPVIRLDTFYGIWELFHHILQELCGGIRAVFFVCLENSEAAVLVYEGVLIEFLLCHFPDETTLWNKFHIYLAFLTRICHLFIGFWGIFRIWELDGVSMDPAQETVKSGDGSGIATLAQLHPEDHQTGVRISAAHVLDELDLGLCMLIWMAVRPVRAVGKGPKGTVVLLFPTVDVLSGGLVTDGCLCDAVFQRILNYRLLKAHVLCYLIHGE